MKTAKNATIRNPLISAIRRLKAIGADGFEGLIRDLLSAVVGQDFRLAKSGPQGGVDGVNEPPANSLRIPTAWAVSWAVLT